MSRAKLVTANRLSDGRVVYLTPARGWSFDVQVAGTTTDDAELQESLRWAQEQQTEVVCGPYAVEVELSSGRIEVLSARERIRAAGPQDVLTRFGYGISNDGAPAPGYTAGAERRV